MFKDLSRNLEVNRVNIKIRGGLLGILEVPTDEVLLMVTAEAIDGFS